MVPYWISNPSFNWRKIKDTAKKMHFLYFVKIVMCCKLLEPAEAIISIELNSNLILIQKIVARQTISQLN